MRLKRAIAALLVVCFYLCVFSTRARASSQYTEDDLKYIHSTLISNPHRAEYVDRVMAWHILSETNSYRVGRNLNDGKSVVFLFDGCSDKVDDPVYGDFNSYHISAYCAVVKKVDGVLRIVYESENCATIPDSPRNPELNDGNDVPTLIDGVFSIYSTNHKGRYSALRVQNYNGTAAVIRCNATSSYLSTAVGINIHARSIFPDVPLNSITEDTYSSTGCLVIGLTDNGWTDYDEFIYQVMGVRDAVTTSTFDIGTQCQEWMDMGVVIVDRSQYKEQLMTIYGDDSVQTAEKLVNTITKHSDDLGFSISDCVYTTSVTAPTCTEPGFSAHSCTICGDVYVDGETEPVGHIYCAPVVKEPTCTESGYETIICIACGYQTVITETAPLGHEYADGQCVCCGDFQGLQRGDINGDGAVSFNDAIRLLFHVLFGREQLQVTQEADFNADGSINMSDAVHLMFHVIFSLESDSVY